MPVINKLLELTETVTPLSTLTSLSAKLTEKPLGSFTQFLIRQFIKSFNINLEEIENKDLSSYKTFNDFFTRKLAEGQRPLDEKAIAVSPVDGTVGQAGDIKAGRLMQAKGIDYSLKALVGGSAKDEELFREGLFACIYLSPSNYHRIHMPVDGELVKTIHIPGKHFPVGTSNINHLEQLYTKNERLVCIFKTAYGYLGVVMVGAALVGSIATPWSGTIKRRKDILAETFTDKHFKKGDEIGLFKYGSTVVCLFSADFGSIDDMFVEGYAVKMGQSMIVPGPSDDNSLDEGKDEGSCPLKS